MPNFSVLLICFLISFAESSDLKGRPIPPRLIVLHPADLRFGLVSEDLYLDFRKIFESNKSWQVVSKEKMEKVFRYFKVEMNTPCNELDCAFLAGSVTQAQYAVYSSLILFQNYFLFSINLVSISESKIVWSKNGEIPINVDENPSEALLRKLPPVVKKLKPENFDNRSTQPKGTLCILNVSPKSDYSKVLFELLTTHANTSGKFNLIDEAESNFILESHGIQFPALVPTKDTLVSIGKKLGADYLIYYLLDIGNSAFNLRLTLFDINKEEQVREVLKRWSDFAKLLKFGSQFISKIPQLSVPKMLFSKKADSVRQNRKADTVSEAASSKKTPPPDNFGPEITLVNPLWKHTTVTAANVTIEVKAEDPSGVKSVTINGVPASLSKGKYSQTLALNSGENVITVMAHDKSATQNISVHKLKIIYDSPPLPVNLFFPSHITGEGMRIKWSKNDNTDFQAYKIYYSTSPSVSTSSILAHEEHIRENNSYEFSGLASHHTYYVKVYVFDNNSGTESNEVSAFLNTAPVFAEVPGKTVHENKLLSFSISATDAEGDDLAYSMLLPPVPDGRPVFDPSSKIFSWTPTHADTGNFIVKFEVTDNARIAGRDILVVDIIVNNVHADSLVVRNLLDVNGFYSVSVDTICQYEGGRITHLYLDSSRIHGQLATLTDEIQNFTELRILDLAGNKLTSLPVEIGNLISLKKLGIQGNRLSSLPSGIVNLTNLTDLNVNGNNLCDLSENVKKWIDTFSSKPDWQSAQSCFHPSIFSEHPRLLILHPIDLRSGLVSQNLYLDFRKIFKSDSSWQVIPLEVMKKIFRNYKIDLNAPCNDLNCAFDAGSAANAQYVLYSSLSTFQNYYIYSINIVDMAITKVVWAKNGEIPIRAGYNPSEALLRRLNQIVKEFKPEDSEKSTTKPKGTLCILNLSPESDYSKILFERLSTHAYTSGVYDLVDEAELDFILASQGVQLSSIVPTKDTLMSIGKKLGVDYLIYSRLKKENTAFNLRLALFDINKKELVREWPYKSSDFRKLLRFESKFVSKITQPDITATPHTSKQKVPIWKRNAVTMSIATAVSVFGTVMLTYLLLNGTPN